MVHPLNVTPDDVDSRGCLEKKICHIECTNVVFPCVKTAYKLQPYHITALTCEYKTSITFAALIWSLTRVQTWPVKSVDTDSFQVEYTFVLKDHYSMEGPDTLAAHKGFLSSMNPHMQYHT